MPVQLLHIQNVVHDTQHIFYF